MQGWKMNILRSISKNREFGRRRSNNSIKMFAFILYYSSNISKHDLLIII